MHAQAKSAKVEAELPTRGPFFAPTATGLRLHVTQPHREHPGASPAVRGEPLSPDQSELSLTGCQGLFAT